MSLPKLKIQISPIPKNINKKPEFKPDLTLPEFITKSVEKSLVYTKCYECPCGIVIPPRALYSKGNNVIYSVPRYDCLLGLVDDEEIKSVCLMVGDELFGTKVEGKLIKIPDATNSLNFVRNEEIFRKLTEYDDQIVFGNEREKYRNIWVFCENLIPFNICSFTDINLWVEFKNEFLPFDYPKINLFEINLPEKQCDKVKKLFNTTMICGMSPDEKHLVVSGGILTALETPNFEKYLNRIHNKVFEKTDIFVGDKKI